MTRHSISISSRSPSSRAITRCSMFSTPMPGRLPCCVTCGTFSPVLIWGVEPWQRVIWTGSAMRLRALIRKIAQFPGIVEASAQAHEPHRIAFYLYDIAAEFHALWNKGKDSPQLRFIYETDRELTRARVALVAATKQVLASGLGILGVKAMHEMH